MRGLIVIPDILIQFPYYDYNMDVARMFREITGFEILPYSSLKKSEIAGLDYLISVQTPSNWCKDLTENFPLFGEIPETVKFIYWVDEVQWENKAVRAEIARYSERADLLITPVYTMFKHLYPKQTTNLQFMPWYAASRFVIGDDINQDCDNKCLTVGGACEHWYPLRHKVSTQGPLELGERLNLIQHPHTTQKRYIFEDFAGLLRNSFCSMTASGNSSGILYRFDGTIRGTLAEYQEWYPEVDWLNPTGHLYLKIFETPCTGCLLICDARPVEMFDLGFEAGVNFVAVTNDNVFDVIRECLAHPEDYDQIRRNGMNLIRNNHLREHRVELLKTMLKDKMDLSQNFKLF